MRRLTAAAWSALLPRDTVTLLYASLTLQSWFSFQRLLWWHNCCNRISDLVCLSLLSFSSNCNCAWQWGFVDPLAHATCSRVRRSVCLYLCIYSGVRVGAGACVCVWECTRWYGFNSAVVYFVFKKYCRASNGLEWSKQKCETSGVRTLWKVKKPFMLIAETGCLMVAEWSDVAI